MSSLGSRHGSLLLLVAVLIVVCAMLGASVAIRVQTDGNLAQLRRRDDQLRALAWSGVRVAMHALNDQRDQILAGADFELPESVTVFEDDSRGEQGLITFEPVETLTRQEAAASVAARASGQSALIDVNLADAALLVKLGCDAATAAAVIANRPGGGYALADDVPGDLSIAENTQNTMPRQPGAPLPDPQTGLPSGAATPVSSLLAAAAWDCQQPGAAPTQAAGGASKRSLLGGGIQDPLRAELDRLVGAQAKPQVEAMLTDAAWKGKKLSDAVLALAAAGIAPRQIGSVLDLICADSKAFPRGRLDLLRAQPRLLETLPGIDGPLAERLVATRASLDAGAKADLAWPLTQGVLTPQQFAAIADKVTNRSLQWRVKVRAVIERLGAGGTPAAANEQSGQEPPAGLLVDAIIDCSGPKVRVVGMFDATWQVVANGIVRTTMAKAVVADAPAAILESVDSAPEGGLNEVQPKPAPAKKKPRQPDMVSSRRASNSLRSEDSRVPPPEDGGSLMMEGSESLPSSGRSDPVRESASGDSQGGRSGRWRPR
ncbi:MAG: hypothetical protein NTV94_17825 [Planctomycetota bacterium]|nr:hypothetical protein [Planctomycetota bacterium]